MKANCTLCYREIEIDAGSWVYECDVCKAFRLDNPEMFDMLEAGRDEFYHATALQPNETDSEYIKRIFAKDAPMCDFCNENVATHKASNGVWTCEKCEPIDECAYERKAERDAGIA